jgi:murein DD-endopeptidase MepM/ murein hydrolase activator NlpD
MRRLVVGVVAMALVAALVAPAGAVVTVDAEAIATARANADSAVADLSAVEAELGQLDADIRASEQATADAEAALAGLQAQVRELAVARYMQFDHTTALPGGDINAPERARVFVMVVAGHNLDLMDDYARQRDALGDARRELEQVRARQSERLAELADRRTLVDAELARLELAAATTTTTSTTATPQPPVQTPMQVLVPGPTPGPTPGPGPAPPPPPGPVSGWQCPVRGTLSFVDSWMAPRPGGRSHQGVDIMSPRGTPVVLPVGGRTSFRTGGIGGLTFSLNGDDGNYYYGAHMDSYAGLADGWYPAGTVVGYVGDTGDARGTGTHLHFEIHLGGYGNAVNPYPTTRAGC